MQRMAMAVSFTAITVAVAVTVAYACTHAGHGASVDIPPFLSYLTSTAVFSVSTHTHHAASRQVDRQEENINQTNRRKPDAKRIRSHVYACTIPSRIFRVCGRLYVLCMYDVCSKGICCVYERSMGTPAFSYARGSPPEHLRCGTR